MHLPHVAAPLSHPPHASAWCCPACRGEVEPDHSTEPRAHHQLWWCATCRVWWGFCVTIANLSGSRQA